MLYFAPLNRPLGIFGVYRGTHLKFRGTLDECVAYRKEQNAA